MTLVTRLRSQASKWQMYNGEAWNDRFIPGLLYNFYNIHAICFAFQLSTTTIAYQEIVNYPNPGNNSLKLTIFLTDKPTKSNSK